MTLLKNILNKVLKHQLSQNVTRGPEKCRTPGKMKIILYVTCTFQLEKEIRFLFKKKKKSTHEFKKKSQY